MKKFGILVAVVTLLAVSSGVSWADCEADCDGPFQTCLNLCRQTKQEDSPEAASCVNHCLHGVSGCIKRCKEKDQTSMNFKNIVVGSVPAGFDLVAVDNVSSASCIE